ncbi:BAG family molecular chaperone regulator 4-like [Papaver somniferum]|uniref:BAG family molecular chaperone regulator 4-like n=1 Tax=Papaver somniferum TaxID=3469 RepID=UPI000E702697|nr:BAG family molecular chaperone regulator 4-like [Papaver somniferum]
MTNSSSSSRVIEIEDGNNPEEEIDCEVTPDVQKRGADDNEEDGDVVPTIKLIVSYATSKHEISVPPQATFGDVKKLLANVTGLELNEQRLFFRGKEKQDEEGLHTAGLKDKCKLLLLEDQESKERKLEAVRMNEKMLEACEEVVKVRSEVDSLAEKLAVLEAAVHSGDKVPDKEFVVLGEFLMRQLLKLDGIKAEGEAKAQRRLEVRRVQSLVDTVDNLKAQNANPISNI